MIFLILSLILGLAIIYLALRVIHIRNNIIRKLDDVKRQKAHLSAQYAYHNQLIKNLYDILKPYLKHERDIFEDVSRNRSWLAGNKKILTALYGVVENYPKLKSDSSVKQMIRDLKSNEKALLHEKKVLNKRVSYYNKYISIFPNSLVAKVFNYPSLDYEKVMKDPTL